MAPFEEISRIYEDYYKKLDKVLANASVFAGAFNMGDDPRRDACHQVFYDAVHEWSEQFAASEPSAENAEAVVRYMLTAAMKKKGQAAYWYTYACQKHAGKMIDFLSEKDAAQILADFREMYPKLDWTPVQQEIAKRLTERSGRTPVEKRTETGVLAKWGKRVAALLIGLTIAHLGVTLFLLSDLGSDPFNVLIQGLYRMISGSGAAMLTHGTVHVCVSLLIILVLLFVDRSYVRIGTFLCMILGGPIIDVFTFMLQGIVNGGASMVVRISAVVLGCAILAFGMTIVIKSQAGTGPNDLVAVVISEKRKWKFGPVRIAVDIAFAAIGFAFGGTIGIGTIICLAVVGPVAQVFMPFSEKICKAIGVD